MKLWSGRFLKSTDSFVDEFNASLPVDKHLYKQDIEGSIAHAKMLAKTGIIADEEASQIVTGLETILKEIEAGSFIFDIADEDIHMSIERALTEKIGPVGGKLHTARSRNDQVALDTRMFLKDAILEVGQEVLALQEELVKIAKREMDTILPGYTHLQRAQPILFSHHMMAYFWMLRRDFTRLKGCFKRADVMPLGAAALAGTTYPIDMEFVAKELGFSKISNNSLDAVSDRDFVIEFQAAASMIMMHLSRLAEELIIWSSSEFSFIELDDAYTTGSSIMPQKKNADVAELIRGKTGRVYGNLLQMLTTMKGLPLAYNKDMQEDKEGMLDSITTIKNSLFGMKGMTSTMKIHSEVMRQSAEGGFTNATELADYLVGKGVPFRDAHRVSGNMVRKAIEEGCWLTDFSLEEFQAESPLIDDEVYDVLDIQNAVKRRDVRGGTAPNRVQEQIEKAEKLIDKGRKWLDERGK
ncbi:MAG: argininosuccinate lyase [Candidatus Aquicultor secundus]|uniref:Argininosuccinate lyase n=1 Tax=Candidatus Aquicultor secundus TaxID=1973895 RepID=A0A2M7T8L3_9ACTN|nr:argininosuccinate lyase [Candidatus Aquicultor secundus]NCO66450.1 argininosuccinate lyase [Solirubrobacter sp.]OIO88122.1 MAG: argininosuccinate lyase [Candidatus Aquicultor secundus]PIU27799.1 MAG: argininosuccinate lyase [Candidatus Aquicultor secundus]PIW21189.1 MAG: argininosuccinate lyase [Candidatus Aquicultor secundus]PIX51796.1 MAG: argininosuccinate lyase [Candidatus Aquicultor secundus]